MGRPWTSADDALLRKFHAEGKNDRDLAYILCRAVSGIARHRARLGLKSNGKPGPRKGTFKHTAESRAKIQAAQLKRWREDEQYRQHPLSALAIARQNNEAMRWHIPAEPDDRKYYRKVRAQFGAQYAKAALRELTSTADASAD